MVYFLDVTGQGGARQGRYTVAVGTAPSIDTAQHSLVAASRKYPAAEKLGPESLSATTKPARPWSVTTSAQPFLWCHELVQ